ncbi:MAG: OmpA family protein, partial [Saprospiraceae bacterium]
RDKGAAVKRTHTWTGNPFLELFYITAEEQKGEECGNYIYGTPEKFSDDELNSKFHDAAVAFSTDEQQIFFTRNNIKNGKVGKDDEDIVKLKIFTAVNKGGDKWGDLEGLPFNSDEYSVAHPALTTDGERLFFASDMPGGFGGMDLYVSEKMNGKWGPPMNLGPAINTEGNEIFPYYHATERLYFSSDGQIGLGGLDIYYMDDQGEGQWGEIQNIGYPLNTISDDFGLVMNEEGTCGHFSSDREGGAGRDDIYSFRKTASPVHILVYDKDTKEPIEGASVINDCTGNTLTTGPDGKVTIDMKMDECCNFAASMEGYLDNDKEGCTKDINIGDPVFVEIPLEPESKFELEGVVFDESTGQPLPGATVTLTNDCEDDEYTVLADSMGHFMFPLKEDCCYVVKGSMDGYLAQSIKDQCTRGMTEATTLQVTINLLPVKVGPNGLTDITEGTGDPNDPTKNGLNPDDPFTLDPNDPDFVNRNGGEDDPNNNTSTNTNPNIGPDTGGLVEGDPIPFLVHIYYDFDQSYIREEDYPELENLLNILNDNPDYIVEIGSHTDSRGSSAYNRSLSQRRADSVVRWLTKKGTPRDRLVSVGYGETKNVNNCANRIPCSEQEHQMNRRTEFRILGTMGDYDIRQRSAPQQNVRVDACQGCPF